MWPNDSTKIAPSIPQGRTGEQTSTPNFRFFVLNLAGRRAATPPDASSEHSATTHTRRHGPGSRGAAERRRASNASPIAGESVNNNTRTGGLATAQPPARGPSPGTAPNASSGAGKTRNPSTNAGTQARAAFRNGERPRHHPPGKFRLGRPVRTCPKMRADPPTAIAPAHQATAEATPPRTAHTAQNTAPGHPQSDLKTNAARGAARARHGARAHAPTPSANGGGAPGRTRNNSSAAAGARA